MGALLGAWGLRHSWIPTIIFTAGVMGLVASAIGLAALPWAPKTRWARPFTLAAHMLIMHAAALWGVLKALFGKTPAAWSIPESTRK